MMKKMILILLLMGVCLGACSPRQRLERLVKRHPELKQPDTLLLSDTLYTPGTAKDTSVPIEALKDTVYIEKGKLQILLRKVHDTLLVHGNCKADTVIVCKKVPVTRIVVQERTRSRSCIVIAGMIVMLVMLVLFVLRGKA